MTTTTTKTEEQICPTEFCRDNRSGKVMKKGTTAFIAFLSLIFISGCSSGLNFEMPDLFGTKESEKPKKASVASREAPKEKEASKGGMFYPHLFKGKEDAQETESKKTASNTVDQNGTAEKLSSEELLKTAGNAYQAGKYYDASRKYVSWLHYYEKTASPEDKALACHRLGNIARKRQQYQVSLEYYEKAITFSSAKNTEYLYDVAETLYELEKYPEAQQYFLKVLKLDPQLAQAEKYYGLCLMNQGREECFTPLIQTMGEVNACRMIAEKSYESEKLVLAEKAETRMKEAAAREGISAPLLRNKPDPNLAAKKEVLFPHREQLNAAAPTATAPMAIAAAPVATAPTTIAPAPVATAPTAIAAAPVATASMAIAAAPIATAPAAIAAAPVVTAPTAIAAAPVATASMAIAAAPVATASMAIAAAPIATAPAAIAAAPVATAPTAITAAPVATALTAITAAPVATAPTAITAAPIATAPTAITAAPVATTPMAIAAAPVVTAPTAIAAAPVATAPATIAPAPVATAPATIAPAPVAPSAKPLLASAPVIPAVNTKPALQSATLQTPTTQTPVTAAILPGTIKKESSVTGLPQLKVESSPLLESLGVNSTPAVASAIPATVVSSPALAPATAPVVAPAVASAIPAPITSSPVLAPATAPVVAPAVASAIPAPVTSSPVLAPATAPVVAPAVASAIPAPVTSSPVVAPAIASAIPAPVASSPVLAPATAPIVAPVAGQVTAVSTEIVSPENNIHREEILVYDSSEKPFPVRIIARQSEEYQKLSVFYKKPELNIEGASPMGQTALNNIGKVQNKEMRQDANEDFSNLTMSFLKSGFDLASSDETASISKEAAALGGKKSSSFDETSDFGFAQSGAYTRPGNLPQQFSAQLPANTGGIVPNSVLKEQTKMEIEKENRNRNPRPIPTTIPAEGAAVPIPVSKNITDPQLPQVQNEISNVLTEKTNSLPDNAKVNTETVEKQSTIPADMNNVLPFQQVAGKGLRSLF